MVFDPFVLIGLGLLAGLLNAIAGGGPIIVVAALAAFALPADVASLTSTVSLLPGQVAAGWRARASLARLGPAQVRLDIVAISLTGGAMGAGLLLLTPSDAFRRMLPWLIAFATVLYAWNSRQRSDGPIATQPDSIRFTGLLAPLSIYGGFYGGGNSFMVMALLARTGLDSRAGAHAKNLIILLINAAATGVFLMSGAVAWHVALPVGAGALAGGLLGGRWIDRLNADVLRMLVIGLGGSLALWLAIRG